MAAKSTGDSNLAEDAVERIRELNERIVKAGRDAGQQYLDAYEKTLESIASAQERLGKESDVAWLSSVVEAQANFTRELARMYVSMGRELLK
jgi:Phasin protein